MPTKIINKLYNLFDAVEATVTSKYRGELNTEFHRIETSYEHVEPPVKRATKNLESLIKALNKIGYTVSISQIIDNHGYFVWSCFIHDQKAIDTVVGHSKTYHKTAYQALKEAIPAYGWSRLE